MASRQALDGTSTRSHGRSSRASLATVLDFPARSGKKEGKDRVASQAELDKLTSSAKGAFAVDKHDRIVYWNAGAEKLMGRTAQEAIGRECYEVLAGKDPFGNGYCGMTCPIMSLAAVGTTPEPFCMDVKCGSGRGQMRMRTVALPEAGPEFTTLVHLLDPDDDNRLQELTKGLSAATRGEAMPSRELALPALGAKDSPLTSREREIMSLLSNGFQALNIAARLNLSHATVRNHIQNILRKLEVHTQVEAIALSFRNGWL